MNMLASTLYYAEGHTMRTKCSDTPTLKIRRGGYQTGHRRECPFYSSCTDNKLSFVILGAKFKSKVGINPCELACEAIKDPFSISFKVIQLAFMRFEPR